MEKFCSFPGCSGGCHWCSQVKKQRAEAPLYQAALRVLLGDPSDADVRTLALYVEADTRPRIDGTYKQWLPDTPPAWLDDKPKPRCTMRAGACPVHEYVHGREAEELRKGIETILARPRRRDGGLSVERQLQALLDRVDARDSLAYVERRGRR